jgi:hypothetical protein
MDIDLCCVATGGCGLPPTDTAFGVRRLRLVYETSVLLRDVPELEAGCKKNNLLPVESMYTNPPSTFCGSQDLMAPSELIFLLRNAVELKTLDPDPVRMAQPRSVKMTVPSNNVDRWLIREPFSPSGSTSNPSEADRDRTSLRKPVPKSK